MYLFFSFITLLVAGKLFGGSINCLEFFKLDLNQSVKLIYS